MLLLPFEKFTINTYLSRPSVVGRLESLVTKRTTIWQRIGFNTTDKPFLGKVEKDSFQFCLNDGVARLVCSGYITKADRGTDIHFLFRPLLINIFAAMIFYIAALGSLIFLITLIPHLLAKGHMPTGDGLPWWTSFGFILGYLFQYFWHRYFFIKAKKIILEKIR